MAFHVPEKYRIQKGPLGTDARSGNNGAFLLPTKADAPFFAIASDGHGWEHVSVSLPNRSPTWEEMCAVKALFWDEDDTVMQLHPARDQYVNNHPFCLHLWRPIKHVIPVPPTYLVGVI
jgi:hypothetical protein